MNKQRVFQIIKEPQLYDVLYEEQPVWIQEVRDDIATVGFLNGSHEKDVYIEDLYERDLYEQ